MLDNDRKACHEHSAMPNSTQPQGRSPDRPKASDKTTPPEKKSKRKANKPKRATRARTTRADKTDWGPAYLAALAMHGQKVKAWKTAGIGATAVFDRRNSDPEFAAAEKTAMKTAEATWESEAVRRATAGMVERRYDPKTGKLVSTRTIYSDTILLRLLVRMETGSWRDSTKVEQTGEVKFQHMTRAERLAKLAEAEAAGKAPL